MRYFRVTLETTAEQIEKNASIRLKDYGYDIIIGAVNNYFYRNNPTGITFFSYREEKEKVLSAFSYDDQKATFQDAYGTIIEILRKAFGVKPASPPQETTMKTFWESLAEARRREFLPHWLKVTELSRLTVFDTYINMNDEGKYFRFTWDQKIISDSDRCNKLSQIYDHSFTKELFNIEAHKNETNFNGNLVHYILSAKSAEAANDMTKTLVTALANANRISGRRIEMITELAPDLYRANNHLEEIIENNSGGVIMIDLAAKFGCEPVDYSMTIQYLENLLKKYRNECFVFTYNPDQPGFAYQFLSSIQKYVITVTLREGQGDRKAAVKYMRELIKKSEYVQYAGQTNEFMKLFPGNRFSQTDVLMAFEQFSAWCLNKNVLQAYDYRFSDTFMLDRDENQNSSYDQFRKLIGLASVKEQIEHILAADLVEQERKKRHGGAYTLGSMHMIFAGPPGTAKTTVARLFAGIAKEKGILKSGAFVERGGMDLDGLGCTVKIRDAFVAASGGVLFIDEAYSLKSDIAVTVLLQEMENKRSDVIVILAGYHERMQAFMEINEGLKSRIPHWIDFPDYTTEELTDIFELMIKERGFSATADAVMEARNTLGKARQMNHFGNGRYVRNLIERAIQNQSVRLLTLREHAENIRKKELFLLEKEDIRMPVPNTKKQIGFSQC